MASLCTDCKGHLAPSGPCPDCVELVGALPTEECGHFHMTTMGQDHSFLYSYCFDCHTAWPMDEAPVPGPLTDGSGINPFAFGPN